MVDKIKAVLNSDKGMNVVNLLFLLSIFIRNHGITFIAYTAWIAYLSYFMKKTTSKAVKAVNGIFIVFAISMIVANLYFMLNRNCLK